MKQDKTRMKWRYVRENPVDGMFVLRREYVSLPHTGGVRRSRTHTAVALASLVFFTMVLTQTDNTAAFFNDVERSVDNIFAAGPLGFSLSADPTDDTLAPGESVPVTFVVTPDTDSLPFEYRVSTLPGGGNPAFCGALTASVSSPPYNYSGPLQSLASQATTTDLSNAVVTVSLPEDAAGFPSGAVCAVSITYHAWQRGGNADVQYHDKESVTLTFHASIPEPVVVPLSLLSVEGEVEESELLLKTTSTEELQAPSPPEQPAPEPEIPELEVVPPEQEEVTEQQTPTEAPQEDEEPQEETPSEPTPESQSVPAE